MRKVKENDDIAKMYALQYAESNKPEDRQTFKEYAEIAKTYRSIHSLVCQGLHAVEREMQIKAAAKAEVKS